MHPKAECLNKNQTPSEVTVSIVTRVTESQNHLGWKRPPRPWSPTSTQHHHHHTQAMIPTVQLLSYQHQVVSAGSKFLPLGTNSWVPAPGYSIGYLLLKLQELLSSLLLRAVWWAIVIRGVVTAVSLEKGGHLDGRWDHHSRRGRNHRFLQLIQHLSKAHLKHILSWNTC